MKKLIKVTSLLGAVVMGVSATGVGVANAADITDGGNTKAKVEITKDDEAKVELTQAPEIDFGSHKTSDNLKGIAAVSLDSPITVKNGGVEKGWTINVANSDFTDGTTPFTGAVINLKSGNVSADDTTNNSAEPTSSDVVLSGGDGTASQTIFKAAPDAGYGTWHNTHDVAKVTLDLPDGTKAGNYTSTLTWTLENTPA